jgi:hypothetical protein
MVNIADPEDVRAKLAEAEAQQEAAERARNYWSHAAERLRLLAGDATPEVPLSAAVSMNGPQSIEKGPGHVQDLIIDVIERQIDPVRAKDVTAILHREGHDISSDSVSNALWYAAEKSGRILRVGRGLYAPLDYAEPKLESPPPKMSIAEGLGNVAVGTAAGVGLAHVASTILGGAAKGG